MKLRYRTILPSVAVVLAATVMGANALEVTHFHTYSKPSKAKATKLGPGASSPKPAPPAAKPLPEKPSLQQNTSGVKESSSAHGAPPAPKQQTEVRVAAGSHKGSLPHEVQQAFLQRTAAHRAYATGRGGHRHHGHRTEPHNVEDMETIWGVPKIVWVILADVLAMAGFLACIPFVMYLAKRRRPEMGTPREGNDGCCACLYPPEPPKQEYGGDFGQGGYNPAYSGNFGGGYQQGGYNPGFTSPGAYNTGYNAAYNNDAGFARS